MGRMLRLFGRRDFRPTDVPGLALWADATVTASLTMPGNRVSLWNDLSGKGNHLANGTGAQQPLYVANGINNRAAIQFNDDGNFKFLSAPDASSLDYSAYNIFAVIRRATDLNATETITGKYAANSPSNQREFRLIVSGGDTAQLLQSSDGTGGTEIAAQPAGALSVDTIYIVDGSFSGGTASCAINNGTPGTQSIGSVFNGTSSFYVGCRDVAAEKFSGYVGEVIFYTQALSAGSRLNVLRYLSKKWGVTIA